MKCKICKREFKPPNKELNRGNGRLCSRACSARKKAQVHPGKGKTYLTYTQKKSRYGNKFAINQLAGAVQCRAKRANLPCEVDSDLLRELWKRQSGRCFYSGQRMKLGAGHNHIADPDGISVDRIRPTLGYTRENVVLCAYWVNTAKGRGPGSKLIKRCKKLVAYQESK